MLKITRSVLKFYVFHKMKQTYKSIIIKMWQQISLRNRIYALLAALVIIPLMGSMVMVMVWYTYRMEGLMAHIIGRNIAAFQAAEAL